MILQKKISRLLSLWMTLVVLVILYISRVSKMENAQFYRFGAHDDLIIMGFVVDTTQKYVVVVSYCFINSMFRTLFNSVLKPYVMNNIQDEKRHYTESISFAYEISCVNSIYSWFDWYIYMNILLSQVDMVLFEVTADLLMTITTTHYYLNYEKPAEYSILV